MKLGGLSKPRQVKSVIGLFRRESSGSQSCGDAGSDPTLAGHLNVEMQTVGPRTPSAGRASLDRRSASVSGSSCVVSPIAAAAADAANGLLLLSTTTATPSTASTTNGNDFGGGAAALNGAARGQQHAGPFAVTASHRRNNKRRSSLLELNG